MKSLNINIPTTVRFIRKIMKFWLVILVLLIALLYTYFWLNLNEEKIVHIKVRTEYLNHPNLALIISLNNNFYHKERSPMDCIKLRMRGNISDTLAVSRYYRLKNKDFSHLYFDSEPLNFFDMELEKGIEVNKKDKPYVLVECKSSEKIKYFEDNRRTNSYREEDIILEDSVKYSNTTYMKKLKYVNSKYDIYELACRRKGIFDTKEVYIHKNHYILKFDTLRGLCEDGPDFLIENNYYGNFFTSSKGKVYTRLKIKFEKVNEVMNFGKILKCDIHEIDYFPNSIRLYYSYAPLLIQSISPEPDSINSSFIEYSSINKMRAIKDDGFLIYAENINTKERNEKINFLLASLIGVLFSVLAEIGVKYFDGKKKGNSSSGKSKIKDSYDEDDSKDITDWAI